jgi:hypothetical protein
VAPAALVPRKDLDVLGCEGLEELIVAIDVLAEAMDEDEVCFGRTSRLSPNKSVNSPLTYSGSRRAGTACHVECRTKRS